MKKTLIVLLILTFFTISTVALKKQKDAELIKKALEIHERVLTVDTHTDTPFMLERKGYDVGKMNDYKKRGGRVDYPRMKKGGLDAVFFAVFLGQGKRDKESNEKVKKRALYLFGLIHKNIKKYPELAELGLRSNDAALIEKKGKRTIYIGIENGYPVGREIRNIKKYYDLGARYITLCHTKNNDICDSSTDKEEHGGLSEFGKKVVAEMNRLGMIIDVSHISDKAFYDVVKYSKTPVIASHSCARAICDNPRNLSDDMLKKLAENDGVIQLCILSDYVKKIEQDPKRVIAYKKLRKKYKNYGQLSKEKKALAMKEWMGLGRKYPAKLATVSDAVDHIDHIVKVIGIDHVGIGTDFDGGGGLKDCVDASQLGNITIELVRRGYTEEQIRKIWGGNFFRVFKKIENLSVKKI